MGSLSYYCNNRQCGNCNGCSHGCHDSPATKAEKLNKVMPKEKGKKDPRFGHKPPTTPPTPKKDRFSGKSAEEKKKK